MICDLGLIIRELAWIRTPIKGHVLKWGEVTLPSLVELIFGPDGGLKAERVLQY